MPGHVRELDRRSVRGRLDDAGVKRASVVGLGVAVPDDLGLVDLPGRPATYAEWDAIDMAELFEEPFDLPVFVENDAAAAARSAERRVGKERVSTCRSRCSPYHQKKNTSANLNIRVSSLN